MSWVRIDYMDGQYSMERTAEPQPDNYLGEVCLPEPVVLAWEQHRNEAAAWHDYLRRIDNEIREKGQPWT